MSAVLATLTFICAWIVTGAYMKVAIARGILDLPNSRSSHVRPTPRGGGVGIATAATAALTALLALGVIPVRFALCAGMASAAVALIGFLDDKGHVSRRARLAVHLLGAALLLFGIRQLPTIDGLPDFVQAPAILAAIYLLFIVASINITNFMDGIDGLAGAYTVCVCIAGSICTVLGSPTHAVTNIQLPLVLAAATLGFLRWNWAPARIFLGDVGSGYLGFMLSAVAFNATSGVPRVLCSWWILMGTFVVDASVTLIVRLYRGERVHEAHRTHAYQHAAQKLNSHAKVSLAYIGITLFWLLPLAVAVATDRLQGRTAMFVAYAPLACAAILLHAGRQQLD